MRDAGPGQALLEGGRVVEVGAEYGVDVVVLGERRAGRLEVCIPAGAGRVGLRVHRNDATAVQSALLVERVDHGVVELLLRVGVADTEPQRVGVADCREQDPDLDGPECGAAGARGRTGGRGRTGARRGG